MTYLEMKYNLMLQYCQLISFYIYLKLDPATSGQVSKHPVIAKLVYVKTLFDKLGPLAQKLQYQIDKILRQAALNDTQGMGASNLDQNLKFKPKMKYLEDSVSEKEGDEQDEAEDDIQDESDIESEGSTKRRKLSISDDEEETTKPGIYKANKLNPMVYNDSSQKHSKKK